MLHHETHEKKWTDRGPGCPWVPLGAPAAHFTAQGQALGTNLQIMQMDVETSQLSYNTGWFL